MKKRLDAKPYLREISSHPTRLWFKAKRYGWGWYPATWQGLAVIAMYVFCIFAEVLRVTIRPQSTFEIWTGIIPQTYILTVFLIIICYATGEKPGWRWGSRVKEKFFDVLDEHGIPTGAVAPRSEVHDKGLWHRAAHVYVVNSKDEVLLQCRSAKNSFRPGRWYLSFGGHIEKGETSIEAAQRLAHDELGLTLADADFELAGTIQKQNVLLYGTYINNEFDDIYVVRKDLPDVKVAKALQDEITKIAWVSLDEFKSCISNNDPAFVNYAGLPVLFKYLDSHAR